MKCCSNCGKLFRQPNRDREGLLSSCGRFSQTVYGLSACCDCLWASWTPLSGRHERAKSPKSVTTCHCPPSSRTEGVIQLHDSNNTFRNLNYRSNAVCLTQPSWSQRDLTAKQRIVLVLHFQFLALRLFSSSDWLSGCFFPSASLSALSL